MPRELASSIAFVADSTEHGDLDGAAEALAGIALKIGIAILVAQIAGDLRKPDNRIDVAACHRALAMARKELRFRIHLRGETAQQA